MNIKGIKKVIDASLKSKEKIVNEIKNIILKNGGIIYISQNIAHNMDIVPYEIYEKKNEVYLKYNTLHDYEKYGNIIPGDEKLLYDMSLAEINYIIDCMVQNNISENERHK